MDVGLWLGLGLIAGGVVSLIFDDSFTATLRNIIFGLAGSIIGAGIITKWDSGRLPTLEFYTYSIIFTIIVSCLMIAAMRLHAKIISQPFTPLNIKKKDLMDKIENVVNVSPSTEEATT